MFHCLALSDCSRRMYQAAELRKGSARPSLSEKELVASEKVRFIDASWKAEHIPRNRFVAVRRATFVHGGWPASPSSLTEGQE